MQALVQAMVQAMVQGLAAAAAAALAALTALAATIAVVTAADRVPAWHCGWQRLRHRRYWRRPLQEQRGYAQRGRPEIVRQASTQPRRRVQQTRGTRVLGYLPASDRWSRRAPAVAQRALWHPVRCLPLELRGVEALSEAHSLRHALWERTRRLLLRSTLAVCWPVQLAAIAWPAPLRSSRQGEQRARPRLAGAAWS